MPTGRYEKTTLDSTEAKRVRGIAVLRESESRDRSNREVARLARVSEQFIRSLRRELGLKSPVPPVGQRKTPKSAKATRKTPAPPVEPKGAGRGKATRPKKSGG